MPSSTPEITTDLPDCPKCGELLSQPYMKAVDHQGLVLAYDCPACEATFVFTPITTFHLTELR